jgi:hypothetical protein
MWQTMKVARGGIESVGVLGEPTTHATPFKNQPPVVSHMCKVKENERKQKFNLIVFLVP